MSADNRFDLSGKVALVTGGSKGLGKAMARGFAEHGADVMICARTEEELNAAVTEISDGLDVRVECKVTDMTDRNAVKELASETIDKLGKVDILVNNAGSDHLSRLWRPFSASGRPRLVHRAGCALKPGRVKPHPRQQIGRSDAQIA